MFFDLTYKIKFEDGSKKELITGDSNVKRVVKDEEKDKGKKATKIIVENKEEKNKFIKENNKLYKIEKDGSKVQTIWLSQ